MKPTLDLTFTHSWTVEVLEKRPLIAPARQFVYPQQTEEVERGALELLVKPATGNAFLATCALGFADSTASTGIWSCPNPDWLCAVSGGYAYLINTLDPQQWSMVPYRPVLSVRVLAEQQLLLFIGHHSILALGRDGQAWESARLSWEGIEITDVVGDTLCGLGWDLMTDNDVPFAIDLKTGEHTGGAEKFPPRPE
ncbi:hypothetical protein [Alloacidobacterium sp.]|uniref:hypothetical protein n=1 Tax=Alloacidobacterium sp. TaxID=2951999 RepID=UPI002D5876AF|nr:hypothetical protein [Alloacidobacterium sp.]HYK36998.1 hypothetical protein [Alloacidobacterium sp.]